MARYRQSYDNSCGAAALMCAASELGIKELPRAGKWSFLQSQSPLTGNTSEVGKALLTWDGRNYTTSLMDAGPKLKEIETALYAVTSGDLSSYSMPSRIIACATQLGLKVKMYAAPGMVKNLLTWKYDKELEACTGQDIKFYASASPGPAGEERELIVFRTFVIGLHYVMRRPSDHENTYMDPGDGQDYKDFEALNTGAKFYADSGISLILSKSA